VGIGGFLTLVLYRALQRYGRVLTTCEEGQRDRMGWWNDKCVNRLVRRWVSPLMMICQDRVSSSVIRRQKVKDSRRKQCRRSSSRRGVL
jgi:hypothetical protein